MKFSQDEIAYLKGSKFSNALRVKISEKENKVLYRIDYLENLARNKKVIHIGCVDHIPLIEKKIKYNTWLHKRLVEASERCLGIDIDEHGIDYIQKLGYPDVLTLDIIQQELPDSITNDKWDYLILGEILEHINNPVQFLETINSKFKDCVNLIIITVPYAFRLSNFKLIIKHSELINSDHRFWFTPYTLAKLLFLSCIEVISYQFCHSYYLTKFSLINKFLLTRFPGFRDTLVMIGKFN